MSLRIQWRDLTKRGIAAWANQTLEERVIDLLSDIMLASEEIESMVAAERGAPPFPDFYTGLSRIYSEASTIIGRVVEPAPERKTKTH